MQDCHHIEVESVNFNTVVIATIVVVVFPGVAHDVCEGLLLGEKVVGEAPKGAVTGFLVSCYDGFGPVYGAWGGWRYKVNFLSDVFFINRFDHLRLIHISHITEQPTAIILKCLVQNSWMRQAKLLCLTRKCKQYNS